MREGSLTFLFKLTESEYVPPTESKGENSGFVETLIF